MEQLRAKAVQHASGAGQVGLAQCSALLFSLQELAGQYAPVDEVDPLAVGVQDAPAELQAARVRDEGADPPGGEKVAEQLELAGRGKAPPVDDRHHRGAGLSP